ncbi:MAG: Transposase IS200 like protein [candidate division WS6 bacterium OLB20]|uniref:Transposase IS200 like protein n=1 Tax=candidate division WS6 bacterium OLB20 TaxID=1617426 RepID=A0A136LYJ6_9BACT|nr:MAG: Transposase IS200 like protein [candidate division WS6 bacterium OLB20]
MSQRSLYPGSVLHIFNRGSKKELIFQDNADYERFLLKAFEINQTTKNRIINYCLLPNHFHFLIAASDMKSIPRFMHRLQVSHSRYYMYKYHTVGRVFQGRYKSVVVNSDAQLRALTRYIHRNPVEYFNSPEALKTYPWSSYQSFGGDQDSIIKAEDKGVVLSLFNSVSEYRDFIEADEVLIQSYVKSEAISYRQLDLKVKPVD